MSFESLKVAVMLFVPTPRAEVTRVATPLVFKELEPRTVIPDRPVRRKFTVPAGGNPFPATVAVKVTGEPSTTERDDAVRVTVAVPGSALKLIALAALAL